MPKTPHPEHLSDDAPEAGAEWFAKARPAAEVLPELFGAAVAQDMLKPARGRPALAQPKAHVNIRLDQDVLAAFKSSGTGWQTRVNQALREWIRTHPTVSKG